MKILTSLSDHSLSSLIIIITLTILIILTKILLMNYIGKTINKIITNSKDKKDIWKVYPKLIITHYLNHLIIIAIVFFQILHNNLYINIILATVPFILQYKMYKYYIVDTKNKFSELIKDNHRKEQLPFVFRNIYINYKGWFRYVFPVLNLAMIIFTNWMLNY